MLKLPISQALPSPNFFQYKHDHAPQADGAESNNHLSGDEELDFYTGYVPI